MEHNEKEQKWIEIFNTLNTWRLDIKNMGSDQNSIELTSTDGKITVPDWFTNEQGIGKLVIGNSIKTVFTLKAINDGKLLILFKSEDKKIGKEKIPIYIDYKSIKIDGQEILSLPVSTWHDRPFRYEKSVKDGQEVIVEIEQEYHQYIKDDLINTIGKLFPDDNFVNGDASLILKELSPNIAKYSLIPLDTFPQITADCFIPLGFKCQTAWRLKEHKLRFCSLPFDWIFDSPLYMFIDSIQKGISCWLSSYSEFPPLKRLDHRKVQDNNNRMIFLHDFPKKQSVEEYMSEFKEKYNRRINRMIDIIKKSNKICIVCSDRKNADIEFFNFMKKLHELYPDKMFYLLHIKHSELKNRKIWSCSICNNAIMYCINAWNIAEYDPDGNGWGNEKLWDEICSNLSLSNKTKNELKQLEQKETCV